MKKLILAMVFVLICGTAFANPLLGGSPPRDSEQAPSALGAKLMLMQAEVNHSLSDITAALKDGASPEILWTAIILSLAYGVLHALGPGHAKTIIASYMLTHRARWQDGIWIAVRFALAHVAGALVIAFVLFILQKSILSAGQETAIINVICYSIIGIIGLSLIYRAIGKRHSKDMCDHDHHDHDHDHAHHKKGGLWVAITAGLIPCPGPILVLTYAIVANVLAIGVLLALLMALGMAVTISAVAILSIYSRRGVMHLSSGQKQLALYAHRGLMLLGGSLIVAFAAWQLSFYL